MHDLISRQEVIDVVSTWFELYVLNRTMADTMSIQDMIRALPSAQPELGKNSPSEQQNCPYCHEDADGYLMPLRKNIHIYMRPTLGTWTLHFRANGWSGGCVIQYCPMCGRRLEHG